MDSFLEQSIKDEEERLRGLIGIRKKFFDIETDTKRIQQEIRDIEKQGIETDEKRYKKLLDDLRRVEKIKKQTEETVHNQAVKNIVKEENLQLDVFSKIQAERLKKESEYQIERGKYISSRTRKESALHREKMKDIQAEIDRLKKLEDSEKKRFEYEEKRSKIIKSQQMLLAYGDKKGAKKAQKELEKLEKEQRMSELKEKVENGTATKEEYNEYRIHETTEKTKEELGKFGKYLKEQMSSMFNNGINSAIEDATGHRTRVMTRLQGMNGSEYDYNKLLDTVAGNLAVSPYVTQRAFMKKLDEAVDKGIAYNVEQRTFLATVSDKIATTFDAFDSNLLRLIKLQQADSTAARLGMEAALTKTLNSVFSDSSYLTDEVYKNVRGALVEAESTMGRNMATEFEYVVQKWLGALYSLGASNELVNQIAQGLNYIGTGNVQALANNAPLQTLFAMSASRTQGVDYADLLVGGLTTEKTNELLKSMVEYLKEIAEDNKNNNVVKSAYGDIYKLSLADMRAITSLTEGDISSIYSQNMSYSDMGDSLSQQFNSISKRLSTPEMIKNVIDNFTYTIGSEIAESAVSYVLWEVTDLIGKSTDGIHLPAISVFGNMVDLSSFTVEGMMKTGLVGIATLGRIGDILSSLNKGGTLSMDAWGYKDTMQRGQIETQTAGSISSTSGSTYVGSSSSSDMKNSSIASATEDAGEVAEITNADNESEYTFDDWYKAILVDQEPIYTKSGEEFSVSDLYETMYRNGVPVPVEISPLTKLGSALDALATYLLNAHRITDVNIKKSDISVPVTVQDFESKFKNEIRNYIKSVYIETLSQELKENLIGNTRGASSATIAKVCDKILNDKVDVMVENDGFDLFLANSYALHG